MKKTFLPLLIIVLAVFTLSSVLVNAVSSRLFVNDSSSQIPEFFNGVYAIGDDGTSILNSKQVYALTSNGLQSLGSANCIGGGGLISNNGKVSIQSDTVRVGLYYFYSKNRDCSIEKCSLENVKGSGFSIGYYDGLKNYQELLSTDYSKLSVFLDNDNCIKVSSSYGEELITFENSGKNNYLYVIPNSIFEEAITKCVDKSYFGAFAFADLGNGKLTVVNELPIEQYVMGVCACEMIESWPVEALKAQAVAARTFVQRMIGTSVYYYTCGFDVTADTYTQAYLGNKGVGTNIKKAVTDTNNQYLTYNGSLIDALYSAADGGATEDSINVFGVEGNPYLAGIIDPFEESVKDQNPYSSWTVTYTPAQLGGKVGIGSIKTLNATYSNTGNVIKIDFTSNSGQTATIIRDSCRTALGLKNIHYKVTQNENGNFVFSGSGFGHNVGMSQWGAYAMAKNYSKSYEDILGFYYTKVSISYGVIK